MQKIMRKKATAFLVLLFMLSAAACGAPAENVGSDSSASHGGSSSSSPVSPGEPETVDFSTYGSRWLPSHDYKTMPVGAYNSIPPAKDGYNKNFLTDEEIFKAYAEAGVNTMMGLTDYIGLNQKDVQTALDYCYDYGLSYLIAYAGAGEVKDASSVRSTLAQVMYHDSFGGIMLYDEPGRVQFENLSTARGVFEEVLEEAGDKLYHVNLFPTYATQRQLWYRNDDGTPLEKTYTYEQYLDDFMEIYNPQVLSYDFYPIDRAFPELSNGYFENMSVIRAAALEANIPFWTFIQTCSFYTGQRLPSEAELLWNVNTCLAYGAKGIQYFCGVNPMGNFTGSIFDREGNKTEMYDIVKSAGKMISAVDEVLMCSKSEGLLLAGVMPQLNRGEARMTIPEEDLVDSYKELLSAEANHALIGCFDYNGKTALYVVNNAIADDTIVGCTAADTVKLNFEGSISGYTLNGEEKKEFSASSVSFDLGAGEGMLVVLG